MMNGTNLNGTNRGGAEVAERSLSFQEEVSLGSLRVHLRDLRVSTVRSFRSKEVSR
jgi:hypothetical protein